MEHLFYEQVRSADGPYVTVEVDDIVGTGGPILAMLAVVAARLHLIEGTRRVRVGINRGAQLEIFDHGYRDADTAHSVARALADEVNRVGLATVKAWDQDHLKWRATDTT